LVVIGFGTSREDAARWESVDICVSACRGDPYDGDRQQVALASFLGGVFDA